MKIKGFTLIELVIVIVLLSIISAFTFRFVGIGADMYATGAARIQLLEQSRFAVERITRELRNSVPNSARVINSGQCLEFVPIKAAGTYYKAPFSPNSSASLDFFSFSERWSEISSQKDRLFIYATHASYIYNNQERRARVKNDSPSMGTVTTLELESDSYFSEKSPGQRLFIGKAPVSFCTEGTQLKRHSDYGWGNDPLEASEGVVITDQLVNMSEPFRVNNAALMRNNVILIFLEYQSANTERLFYNREVHIPNAP
ncbi:PilW family protein [Idiomarina ramblicola]|uniref:Pilus assembly protein n=1 Tax=Idiomarina ramblicola TaxID=263724 RepID=A0A432Z230_9GAMM|nr:type II secretion system protein [Idiomarina ramblicola]RUO71946.1 pilus assembly protein [Idiomarina ramblicola]